MKGRIEFRINEDLFAVMQKNMNRKQKVTMSSYLKELILEDDPDYQTRKNRLLFLQAMQNLTYEINKIGTNINQIAKAVNEGNYYVPYHDTLLMQMESICQCVEEYSKKWHNDLEQEIKGMEKEELQIVSKEKKASEK